MSNWKNIDLFNPTEEHALLRKLVSEFTRDHIEPQANQFNREEIFNISLFRELSKLGLLGITADEKFGGSAFDPLSAVIVHEEISYSDPAFCLSYLAHSMLCVNNLSVNATEEQKTRFLPKLCSGEWIGAMAMSEANAGTDVLGMKTTARKDKDSYILNGQKMWITNGTLDEGKTACDVVLVYARTNSSTESKAKISTFIIDKNCVGFTVGQKIKDKLGMRSSNTAELIFNNCIVSIDNLIGAEGDSMIHMMRNLEIERITLAAMSLGIARRALEIMVDYAKVRKAFNKQLSEFGQIQKFIAESYAELQAARSYVYNTARSMNLDKAGNRLNSDGAKLFATPVGKNIADRAIQVLGGNGYVGEYIVERLWRDAKLLEIGGGTLESHQKNITKDLISN